MQLNTVYVMFSDPKYNYSTSVSHNSTEAGCKAYFVGKLFDLGVFPEENLQKCVGIEFTDNNAFKPDEVIELLKKFDSEFTHNVNSDKWYAKWIETNRHSENIKIEQP